MKKEIMNFNIDKDKLINIIFIAVAALAAILLLISFTMMGKNNKSGKTASSSAEKQATVPAGAVTSSSADMKQEATLPGFTCEFDGFGGKANASLFFEGYYKNKEKLYLYDAKTDKEVAAFDKPDGIAEMVKESIPLLFIQVEGLSKDKQKKLADSMGDVKTPDEIKKLYCLGFEINGGGDVHYDTSVGSTFTKEQNSKALKLIDEYLAGKYEPSDEIKTVVESDISSEYPDGVGIDGYRYAYRLNLTKPGSYSYYVATKDKKLKSEVFTKNVGYDGNTSDNTTTKSSKTETQ